MEKKQLMLAGAALAAVLVTGAQSASADEVKSNSGSISQTADSTDPLAKAKQQVQTAQNNVDQAQTNVSSAQDALNSAQTLQSQAQQVADQAQTNVNSAQAAANDAQKAVDNGKATADQKLQDTTANEQQVADDQTAVKSAQSAVNSVQAALNDSVSQDGQKALSDAEQAASQAQTAVDQAQSAYSQASQGVQTAQANADQLRQVLDNTPEYTETPADDYQGLAVNDATQKAASDYLKAWQSGASSTDLATAKEALFKALDTNMPSDGDLMDSSKTLNKYQYNQSPKLKEELISSDGLTDEQAVRLAEYAAYLVNQVRDALGFTPYVGHVAPTTGMMELAKQVMNGYVADNWDITVKKAHDNTTINKAAMLYGVAYPADNNGQYIEDADSEVYPSQQLTMNDLFGLVFSNMRTFFFDDGGAPNHGHAISLLGMDYMNSFKRAAQKVSYFGFAYNPMSNGDMQDLNTHYLIVPDLPVMITNDATFNAKNGRTTIENKALNSAYEDAKRGYATALQKLAEAKDAQADAQTVLNKAQLKLAQEQADLAAAKQKTTADSAQATELTQKLNTAKSDLAKAQQQLQADQAKLDEINAANDKIKTAKKEQTNREQKLAAVKDALVKAQADLQTAKQTLNDAKAQTAAKQAALTMAQTALQTAQQQLTTAKARLTALEAVADASKDPHADKAKDDDSNKDQAIDNDKGNDSSKDQNADTAKDNDSSKDQNADKAKDDDSNQDQSRDLINYPSIDAVEDQVKGQDLKPTNYPSIDAVEDIVPDEDSANDNANGNDQVDYQNKDLSNHLNNGSYQDINNSSYNGNDNDMNAPQADSATILPQTGNERSESASVIGLLGMALAGLTGVSVKRRRTR